MPQKNLRQKFGMQEQENDVCVKIGTLFEGGCKRKDECEVGRSMCGGGRAQKVSAKKEN